MRPLRRKNSNNLPEHAYKQISHYNQIDENVKLCPTLAQICPSWPIQHLQERLPAQFLPMDSIIHKQTGINDSPDSRNNAVDERRTTTNHMCKTLLFHNILTREGFRP